MNNILVIYHHKTGCALSKNLFKIYQKILKSKMAFKYSKIKEKSMIHNNELKARFNINFKLKENYNFYYEASPNFIYNIHQNLKFNYVIHFIRDPYDQCVSNFNYHILDPTPEKWFLNVDNNICEWFSNSKLLNLLFSILDIDKELLKNIRKYLKKNFNPKKNKSYYENLKILKEKSIERALIVETLRFILDTKHILKMACIIKLNYENKDNTLYLKIDDFKNDEIKATIDKINKFLFNNEEIKKSRIIYLYKKKYDSIKKGVHISTVNYDDKEKLKNILKNNELIKTIFDKVTDIISNYT